MKIIENNYIPPIQKKSWVSKIITCKYCNSKFEIEPHDVAHCGGWEHTPLDWSDPYDYVRCPCCNREIEI